MIPENEEKMVKSAERHLSDQDLYFHTEVPFLGRIIDLVFIKPPSSTISIEFKRHDWRSAIVQAKDHFLGADRSFICLPDQVINDSVINCARENNIGIYAWTQDNPLQEVLDSESSDGHSKPVGRKILATNLNQLIETQPEGALEIQAQ